MVECLHQVAIEGRPEDVFLALTTSEGLSGWWTPDVTAEPKEGSVTVLGFHDRTLLLRMRVKVLVPNSRVLWSCSGAIRDWDGTTISIDIKQTAPGVVTVLLTHGGWRSTEGAFRRTNTDWGRLLYGLKDYVEGRGIGPLMR